MIVQFLVASSVIFVVACGWILIDRLFRKSVAPDLENCSQPSHECGHCILADACSIGHNDTKPGQGETNQSI